MDCIKEYTPGEWGEPRNLPITKSYLESINPSTLGKLSVACCPRLEQKKFHDLMVSPSISHLIPNCVILRESYSFQGKQHDNMFFALVYSEDLSTGPASWSFLLPLISFPMSSADLCSLRGVPGEVKSFQRVLKCTNSNDANNKVMESQNVCSYSWIFVVPEKWSENYQIVSLQVMFYAISGMKIYWAD